MVFFKCFILIISNNNSKRHNKRMKKNKQPEKNKMTETQIVEFKGFHHVEFEKTHPSLVILKGYDHIGKVFVIKNGNIIGRGDTAQIKLNDTTISRQHVKITVLDDNRVAIEDLGSRNGLYVNDIKVTKYILSNGDRVKIGNTLFKFTYLDDIERSFQRRLYTNAIEDPVTGIYNKRFFNDILSKEISYSNRHKSKVGLIIFDIDNFKAVNDSYGHTTGDVVLKQLCDFVRGSIRNEDIFSRIGGEEFGLIIKGIPKTKIVKFAERLRKAVSEIKFNVKYNVQITISLGMDVCDSGSFKSATDLIEHVDALLYQAKKAGKNTTVYE